MKTNTRLRFVRCSRRETRTAPAGSPSGDLCPRDSIRIHEMKGDKLDNSKTTSRLPFKLPHSSKWVVLGHDVTRLLNATISAACDVILAVLLEDWNEYAFLFQFGEVEGLVNLFKYERCFDSVERSAENDAFERPLFQTSTCNNSINLYCPKL